MITARKIGNGLFDIKTFCPECKFENVLRVKTGANMPVNPTYNCEKCQLAVTDSEINLHKPPFTRTRENLDGVIYVWNRKELEQAQKGRVL